MFYSMAFELIYILYFVL